jgi:hypothetical protein
MLGSVTCPALARWAGAMRLGLALAGLGRSVVRVSAVAVLSAGSGEALDSVSLARLPTRRPTRRLLPPPEPARVLLIRLTLRAYSAGY